MRDARAGPAPARLTIRTHATTLCRAAPHATSSRPSCCSERRLDLEWRAVERRSAVRRTGIRRTAVRRTAVRRTGVRRCRVRWLAVVDDRHAVLLVVVTVLEEALL